MTLYHYTSGQGLYGILNSSELHCSHVNFMNDPSEDIYFEETLARAFKESAIAKKIYDTMYNKSYINAIVAPFDKYIASFSKNRDSLSMWNYYAKGNGYNFGVDIENVIEENADSQIDIQTVELIYNPSQQLEKILELIETFKADCTECLGLRERMRNTPIDEDDYDIGYEEMNLTGKFNTELHTLLLSMKHPAYEREEEVRLIISENKFHQQTTRFKVSENGVFVEYLPLKLDIKSRLESVTVHPLNGEFHLQSVRKFISSKDGLSKIKINPSSIPFRIV